FNWTQMDAEQIIERADDALLHYGERAGAQFFSRLEDEPDTPRLQRFMVFHFQHCTDDHTRMRIMTAGMIRAFQTVHFLIKCINVRTYADCRIFITERSYITV